MQVALLLLDSLQVTSVQHAWKAKADLVWMQKAAAHRVHRLAETDAHLLELVEAGVAEKLLAMLKPEVDAGCK